MSRWVDKIRRSAPSFTLTAALHVLVATPVLADPQAANAVPEPTGIVAFSVGALLVAWALRRGERSGR